MNYVYTAHQSSAGSVGPRYYGISGALTQTSTTESDLQAVLPNVGGSYAGTTFVSFAVTLGTAPGVGNSRTFTIRKSGSDTTLTVTISGTSTYAEVTVSGVVFNSTLDTIGVYTDISGTPASSTWSWKILAYGNYQSIFSSTTPRTWSNGETLYMPVGSTSSLVNTTVNSAAFVVSSPGTISGLRCSVSSPPGGGNSFAYTVQKNFSDTTLTTTLSNTGATSVDPVHTVSVVAGDIITLKVVAGGTPSGMGQRVALGFTPSDGLTSIYSGSFIYNATVVRYNGLTAVGTNPTATEANIAQIPGYGIIKNFYVNITTAPGAGTGFTYTVRNNATDTALSVALTDSATTGSSTADVSVQPRDLVDVSITPVNSPATNLNGMRYGFSMRCPSPSSWLGFFG